MVLVDKVGYDLDKIIVPPPLKKPSAFRELAKNVLLIVFFSAFVFFFVNFPAYYLIGKYRFSPRSVSYQLASEIPSSTSENPGRTSSAKEVQQFPDNTLMIATIGVKAPVSWDIKPDDVMNKLQEGLVHLEGTGHPGEGKNIFITGHSSNYWWKKGDYNTVFALLPNLKEGNEIILTYQGKITRYKIKSLKEVKKDEVSNYLDSKSEQLTLMTCVPVGTNLHRLLVFAEPI
jgi:LPXTG-site transpeptidase (sortase) family protein